MPSRAADKPEASPASPCQGEVSVIYDKRVVTEFAAAPSGAVRGAGTCKRLEDQGAPAGRAAAASAAPGVTDGPSRYLQPPRGAAPFRCRRGACPPRPQLNLSQICRGTNRLQASALHGSPINAFWGFEFCCFALVLSFSSRFLEEKTAQRQRDGVV